MSRLIDEIILFLEDNGIAYSRQIRFDFDVICIQLPGWESYKIILPLEITAATIEEAGERNIDTENAIFSIKAGEGYPLIITEDRWRSQRQMMEARLLAHLEIFTSVFARNCEVRKIERQEAQSFLSANHSYGYAACRHRYGLFEKKSNTLIAVATFSNARKWIKDGREIRSYEWTRYASLPDIRISGGMGKLLKSFINEVHPDDVMSYADLEWSEGRVYRKLGFKREDSKAPVDFIINPSTWERTSTKHSLCAGELFFRNFGSAKYRLKLTDYQ